MRLAIFDLDHTLLAGDSDYLWGRFLIERGVVDPEIYERENQRFFDQYKAGTLDIDEFCSFSLKPIAATDPATLSRWQTQFVAEKIAPIVAPGTPALLERHRAQGDHLLITTATSRIITAPIAELLGIADLLATDAEQVDGRYTGRVLGLPNFKDGKVKRLEQWQATNGLQFSHRTAYSDSRNDLPLLESADVAVAVDPDDFLRAEALRRGWQVISLRGPAPAPAS